MARDSKGRFLKNNKENVKNINPKFKREIERPITLKTIFVAFIVGWLAVLFFPKLVNKVESLIVDQCCKYYNYRILKNMENTNYPKNGNSSQPLAF